MTLPYLIASSSTALLLITLIAFWRKSKSVGNLNNKHASQKKNQELKESIVKDAQASAEYGKNIESVLSSFCASIEKNYPFTSLSSIFLNRQKAIFKSQVKETVNRAFIDHIKDGLIQLISNPQNTHFEVEEQISGNPPDNVSISQILSTCDMKITSNNRVVAAINLSSTQANAYTKEDIETLNSAAELLSGFLSKIEAELNIEKSKSISMIDSFSEGIFMLDMNLNLVAMNNSAMNYLNIHSPTPALTDILTALPNTYNFKDKIQTALSLNKQVIEEDIAVIDKVFRIIITPVLQIHTEEKKIIGVSILIQDKTVEKSLAQTKEDFTNIMVHELRSPITAIRASSEFLQSRADLTDAEKAQLMHMISDSSKKMLDKIALILDSAKMDAGLFSIKKTPSDIAKLINDRIALFTPAAQEKSINLKVDLAPALPSFSFDPIRIDEVVNNLLSNSLKFTPEGGSISIKAYQDMGSMVVSVSDTGAGIPKDKQNKLFSKYSQAPTEGQHQGTGLGLYVVKGVIEAHGGKVNLQSEPGHGTTISFTLPISGISMSTATPATPAKTPNPMSN